MSCSDLAHAPDAPTALVVFRRTPFRGGRGRRAAVDFVVCLGCGGIWWVVVSIFFFSFERTRPAASMRTSFLIYLSTSTECESCTKPIYTNPGSTEAGEDVLTRGTCFVARRLGVVAVAGLLWISWFVLGAAGFRFFSSNAHGLLQV